MIRTRDHGSANPDFMLRLREALEASWDKRTAHGSVERAGNAALGQCYPTCRVVQHYFPNLEIIKGKVWTGEGEEVHFWNAGMFDGGWYHVDLTWQQFPAGSVVRGFAALDRDNLDDGEIAVQRCALLLERVERHLARRGGAPTSGPFG